MALFTKTTPEKTAIRNRDAAKEDVSRQAGELAEAEANVIATKQAAVAAASVGDKGARSVAEAAHGAALIHLSVSQEAFANAETLLATLDEQIAKMTDKTTRAATVATTKAWEDALVRVGRIINPAMAELATILSEISPVIFEARGLETYSASSVIELPVAIQIIAEHCREYGRSVMSGAAPPVLPPKEVPFVPEVVTKPETKQVFTTRAISWRENGELRTIQKFRDVELPVAYAKKALKARVCVEIGDPARNPSTHNQWPGHADPAHCFSLDGELVTDTAEPHEVTLHTAFEIVDRGKPYLARVS
jgi:hypothetical protein